MSMLLAPKWTCLIEVADQRHEPGIPTELDEFWPVTREQHECRLALVERTTRVRQGRVTIARGVSCAGVPDVGHGAIGRARFEFAEEFTRAFSPTLPPA